jgi:hypothetical protein
MDSECGRLQENCHCLDFRVEQEGADWYGDRFRGCCKGICLEMPRGIQPPAALAGLLPSHPGQHLSGLSAVFVELIQPPTGPISSHTSNCISQGYSIFLWSCRSPAQLASVFQVLPGQHPQGVRRIFRPFCPFSQCNQLVRTIHIFCEVGPFCLPTTFIESVHRVANQPDEAKIMKSFLFLPSGLASL